MNTIEIKNFRNFEHLEPLSLNDVTILVGPNNSGKSTITKAFRLLGENLYKIMKGEGDFMSNKFENMDFSNVCGNFKRALSTKAHENVIEFIIRNEMFNIIIKVVPRKEENSSFAVIKSLQIDNIIDGCTWRCDLSKNEPEVLFTYSGKFLANLTRLKEWKYKKIEYDVIWNIHLFRNENNKESYEIFQKVATEKNMTINKLCSNTLNSFKEQLDNFHKIEQQYNALTDIPSVELYDIRPFEIHDKKIVLDGINTDIVDGDFERFGDNGFIFDKDTETLNVFFKYMQKCLSQILDKNRIVYIPANESTLESYFRINDTFNADYANKIINLFYKNNRDKSNWVTRMLKKMGICESFSITQVNSDFLYVTITKTTGEVLPLADFGKGVIQLFLKLLHIANSCVPSYEEDYFALLGNEEDYESDFDKDFERGLERYKMIDAKKMDANLKKKIVIFEEPEQNLHPALQSKLADLFMEVSKLGASVLVETHSEYLVRRSQVLVAEQKYKDEQELAEKCPFKVYYIPEASKGQPYDMEYRTDGKFGKKFGKGFFDVADGLMLDLL